MDNRERSDAVHHDNKLLDFSRVQCLKLCWWPRSHLQISSPLPQLVTPAPWHSAAFQPWTKYLQMATGCSRIAWKHIETWQLIRSQCCLSWCSCWASWHFEPFVSALKAQSRVLVVSFHIWKHCENLSNVGSPLGIWTLWPIFGSSGC